MLARTLNRMADRLNGLISELDDNVRDLGTAKEELRKSEERYALVERGVNGGIWDWNLVTGEDYLSPRWKEIIAYRDDDHANIEASFFDLGHPEDRGPLAEAIARHFEHGSEFREEFRLRHKSGDYRWVRSRGEAIRDSSGRPILMADSTTDVTDQKIAQVALNGSEARLALIFDSTSDLEVHFRVDPKRR